MLYSKRPRPPQPLSAAQVLPVSFFERGNNAFFNSVAVFDADGERLGVYRKSHIPDGPGYQVRLPLLPPAGWLAGWLTT